MDTRQRPGGRGGQDGCQTVALSGQDGAAVSPLSLCYRPMCSPSLCCRPGQAARAEPLLMRQQRHLAAPAGGPCTRNEDLKPTGSRRRGERVGQPGSTWIRKH